jgi:hypothetical protein
MCNTLDVAEPGAHMVGERTTEARQQDLEALGREPASLLGRGQRLARTSRTRARDARLAGEHVEDTELLVRQLEDAAIGVLDVEAQRMLDAHVMRERVEQRADAVVAAAMVPRGARSRRSR